MQFAPICLPIVLILGLFPYEASGQVQYRWTTVAKAVLYFGVNRTEKGHVFFTTPGTELLTSEPILELEIAAYDATGSFLEKITPYRVQDVASIAVQPLSASIVTFPEPPPDVAPVESAIQEVEQEKQSAFSQAPFRYLSTYLGLGKESLRASNTDSHFSGQAQLGTFGLEFQVILTPRSSLSTNLQVHSFITSTTTDQNQETTAVRRSYLIAAYQYRAEAFSFPYTSFQIGLGSVELPLLTEPDATETVPDLRSTFATGPYLGIQYLRPLPHVPKLSFGGTLSSIPLFLGSISGASLEASGQALFFPVDNLYLTGALLYRYQSMTRFIPCANQRGCEEKTQTKSDLQLIYLGIGVFF